MEQQLNILNKQSKRVGLKIHRGKTKFMKNFATTQKIEIEAIEIEKVEQYKYLGQTIAFEEYKQGGQCLVNIKKSYKIKKYQIT